MPQISGCLCIELYQNIGINQTIRCGINDNCTIICNQEDACSQSTFYVYNNSINIICYGTKACQNNIIISSNVKSLNITANGLEALEYATIDIDNPDGQILIECYGESGLYIIMFLWWPV